MIRAKTSVRRLIASGFGRTQSSRSYHASGLLGADALDMADTFARRHSELHDFSRFFLGSIVFLDGVIMTSKVLSLRKDCVCPCRSWYSCYGDALLARDMLGRRAGTGTFTFFFIFLFTPRVQDDDE
jgi:hypothetical protein